MTVRAEQSKVIECIIPVITVNMIKFDGHTACYRMHLAPPAPFALFSANGD